MSDDAITVRYASSRLEVARYYWRSWKRRLWVVHLVLLAAIIGAGVLLGAAPIVIVGMCAATIMFLVAYPQLAFKPQMLVLTIDESGVRAARQWAGERISP